MKQLKLVLGIAFILTVAGYLVYSGLEAQVVYYYHVKEAKTTTLPRTSGIRLHGKVKSGSIVKSTETREISFILEDKEDPSYTIAVVNKGLVVPDMFKDDCEAVCEGSLTPSGQFVSHEIQAKCPSKYESK